jgi:hypothetical protein
MATLDENMRSCREAPSSITRTSRIRPTGPIETDRKVSLFSVFRTLLAGVAIPRI